MAGETTKSEAICLAIHPWSQTSHVVRWITPEGQRTTVVRGAVRPKSAFLGQYDLNYTCEIVYYTQAKGGIHALRECEPLVLREDLRASYRLLQVAGYFRAMVQFLAPEGEDAQEWYELLKNFLDELSAPKTAQRAMEALMETVLDFDLKLLKIAGLMPNIAKEETRLVLRGERGIELSAEVASCLRAPRRGWNAKILLDALRVIGVFYKFHVEVPPELRRITLEFLINRK